MRNTRVDWGIPVALIALSFVPALAGAVRVMELVSGRRGGAGITPENARFFAAPWPIMLHIVSVVVYSMLGALQFASRFRRRRRGWHRAAGKILVVSGLVTAFTGLYMTQFYPSPPGDGHLLYAERLVFGWAMVVSIARGIYAIWHRDFVSHGAWMMRAYAIGLGAGTQVLTHLPWFMFVDEKPGALPRGLMMGAGWVINVLVAEWIIRSRLNRTRPNGGPLISPGRVK